MNVKEMSFDFALKIIRLYKQLVDKNEFVISKQLLKSWTSIGANIEEANAGQSKKDFLSKMSIASKESRETRYWLRLLDQSKIFDIEVKQYLIDIEHLINMLTKIVKTTAQKLK